MHPEKKIRGQNLRTAPFTPYCAVHVKPVPAGKGKSGKLSYQVEKCACAMWLPVGTADTHLFSSHVTAQPDGLVVHLGLRLAGHVASSAAPDGLALPVPQR